MFSDDDPEQYYKAMMEQYKKENEKLRTRNANLEEAVKLGDRLARTMDNFDHHPLAKEALIEYRTKLDEVLK